MRSERGVSESVQWTLILPALLLCVLGLIQAGIIIYAHLVTQEAANAAAPKPFTTHPPEKAKQQPEKSQPRAGCPMSRSASPPAAPPSRPGSAGGRRCSSTWAQPK